MLNIISRRSFLERSLLAGAGIGLAALTNVPLVVKRALATSGIGTNGKKLFFLFLRGGNDGLNNLLPYGDPNYIDLSTGSTPIRPKILIPRDPAIGSGYSNTSVLADAMDYQTSGNSDGFVDTYAYNFGIRAGNGFAAIHPSLKFLAPVYNAGDLAIIDRVGYPRHDLDETAAQRDWETAQPHDSLAREGIWYKAMYHYLLNNPTAPLSGVSVQSALPLSLHGSKFPMLNLSDPTRIYLLGIPHRIESNPHLGGTNAYWGDLKALNAIIDTMNAPFPDRKSRQLLQLQYQNLVDTLNTFADIDFTEGKDQITPDPTDYNNFVGNIYVDDENTDGDRPYYLFPTTHIKNGGYRRGTGDIWSGRYTVPTNQYSTFRNIKACALILNKTSARIVGTELSDWDLHDNQVFAGDTTHGAHADLLRTLGWVIYGLYKFFKIYGLGGSHPMPGAQVSWNDVVFVTQSEIGRTTLGNGTFGTDDGQASVMYVAGGAVRGLNKAGNTNSNSGIYECHTATTPSSKVPWTFGSYTPPMNSGTGTLFDGKDGRYLLRAVDFRSVEGEILVKHMGATTAELNDIIPGYTVPDEKLSDGGLVPAPVDWHDTFIAGELGLL